jgi:glycosyltransferase involved in cell wall biosynthesis
MKISIIIPVYNEIVTITQLINNVRNIPIGAEKEIIVVDDGSNDETPRALNLINNDGTIRIFRHEKNRGKGAALRTALRYVTGDIVIIQDADLEYDPHEYNNLLDPIINHGADVVYGSRLSGGRTSRVYMFWHKLGNIFLTFLANLLYNTTLSDIETGYKLFRTEIIRSLNLKSNSFSIEAEITAKIFRNNKYRVYEVPISYYGRTYKEGKKITWRQGFSAIFALFWYRFFD